MNIKEQVLSREQMAHLQELGVDTSDASMAWMSNSDNPKADDWTIEIPNEFLEHYYQVPTYTIGDLIEKLPKDIDGSNLLIEFCASDLGYGDWDCGELYGINAQQKFNDKSLKEALYDLLCWVAENHKELLEVKK